MPNFLFNKWVKIVNNHRINSSVSCDYLSTKKQHNQNKSIFSCVEIVFNNPHILHYSTTKNTYKISLLNLLYKSFTHFPQHLLINPLKEI